MVEPRTDRLERRRRTLGRCTILLVILVTPLGCGSSKGSGTGSDASTGADTSGGAPDSGKPREDGGSHPHEEAGSHVDASGDAIVTGDAGSVTPTASSWLGTNVNADLPFADVTYLLTGFNTPAAQLDMNGYPVAGASGVSSTDIGFQLPSGTYNISFVGTGKLAVSGIGALVGTWQTVSGEQRAQVKITATPGNFGNPLTLAITNTGSQVVNSIHLYMPGIDYDATNPFNPQLLAALTPFRALRFMEWEDINGSKLADWADRPTATQFGSSANGRPYELIVDLINQTGKDGWINVPEHATPAFLTSFATFMATSLDFTKIAAARKAAGVTAPFQLIVENSNETWNTGFTAYATYLAAANMNTSRYTGTFTGTLGPTWMSGNSDLMKVAQYEADGLVAISKAFTTAFQAVGHADAVAPVLSGWALGAAYGDEGLSFIKTNYGDAKTYVTYAALAPYFATPDDTTTGSLSTLFPALQTAATSTGATFQDFVTLGTTYSVSIAAYEGGQGITGTTNELIKHLAQFDARMNTTYTQYLAFWQHYFGNSLFMHFYLAGVPGLPESFFQYGFWGSLPGVAEDLQTCGQNLPMLTGTGTIASVSQYCPKYAALAAHVPQ
jgi:hypothetical protein